MNTKFIEKMENLLEENKIEAEKTIKSLENSIKNNESPATSINHSQIGNHPGDIGSELFEKEKDIALVNNQKVLTNEIDEALNKIENGDYGKCQCCNCTIDKERLEAIPYTTTCINCSIENSKNYNVKEDYVSEKTLENFYDVYAEMAENGEYENVEDLIMLQEENYLQSGCVEAVEAISNQQYKNQL